MEPVPAAAAPDWAPLVDVSGWTMAELAGGDSALARSVRQVLRGLDDPNGVLSAFDSFAPAEPDQPDNPPPAGTP